MPQNKKNSSEDSKKHEVLLREAIIHFQAGRFQAAIQALSGAINIEPNFDQAYSLMGQAYMNIPNHHLEARESFVRSIGVNPQNAEAYFLLGLTLMSEHAWPEAVDSFNLAIHYKPDYAQAYSNRGVCHSKLSQANLALSDFDKAINLKVDFIDALANKGHLLLSLGLKNEAVNILEQARRLDSHHINAALNLSTSYLALNQYDNAIQLLEGIKNEAPTNFGVFQNLGLAYALTTRAKLAFENYAKCIEIDPNNFSIYSNMLLCMLEIAEFDRNQIFSEHSRFSSRVNEYLVHSLHFQAKPYTNDLGINRKLKIGFVSGDLRDHAISYYMEPVFEGINRDHFEIYAYHSCPPALEDATTARISQYFHKWSQVSNYSEQDLYGLIHSDQIDILIDLSGHTGFNRLTVFAMKPAPIQISWIGYPETTGLSQIDYVIFPNTALRGENEPYYSEKIAYIPTPFVFKPFKPSPPVSELPALKNGFLTFGIFGNTRKFSNQAYELWSRVMKENLNSKIIIAGVSDELTRNLITKSFREFGVSADRLNIKPFLPMEQFMALMGEVDICLDTYPYSGGTTTNHALWMGVPTMTISGQTIASHQSGGIMCQYGLGEFCCLSVDEYCSKIHHWRDHLDGLASLRKNIRHNISTNSLISPENALLGLEAAFRRMWEVYSKGQPFNSFAIGEIEA
jgi:predicted O-linked N-acetylglucosamine transferase (SPINDLY family)